MLNFLLAFCIALIAIAFIEWLKKPFEKAPTWIWWALAPILCIALGIVATLLPMIMMGLLAFAFSTLFYDNVIRWAKKKIESLDLPSDG